MTADTDAADQLYGLPPEEFTAARNALAREIGKQGDRQAAEAIKSLRKPSAAAWALNQLARRHGESVRELVGAGRQLRTAQDELLAGGDRDAFREASRREQELVSELARKAVEITRDSGSPTPEALEHRIADTLRAAALDSEVAEALLAGRLVREHAAAGMAGGLAAGAPPAKPRAKGGRSQSAAGEGLREAALQLRDAEKAEEGARKRQESAARQAARLRERAEEALARLRDAEADQQTAEQALTKASEDRSRLARRAEELRRRAGA